jgi:hypothetical protein
LQANHGEHCVIIFSEKNEFVCDYFFRKARICVQLIFQQSTDLCANAFFRKARICVRMLFSEKHGFACECFFPKSTDLRANQIEFKIEE